MSRSGGGSMLACKDEMKVVRRDDDCSNRIEGFLRALQII